MRTVADLLWTPSAERIERANLTKFARKRGLPEGYAELWQWSVDKLEEFWAAIWDEYVDADQAYEQILANRKMPGTEWFPGAKLNYAKHVFRGRDPDALAIQHASESRELASWTWGDLRRETARIRAGLVGLGVGEGDRVAAYMPNIAETVAAFLATASLGAVWASAAPEFGARSVIDRFAHIEPKVLRAIDSYRYGGRDFDCSEKVATIAAEVPGAQLVRFGYLDGSGWPDEFAAEGDLEFAPVAFDHPLWVLYSSGTTGLPKAIVQGQGGILLEQLKKMHLHSDAKPGDRLLWFTTTGWMMWNFIVSGLLTEAAIVLYDGNPGHPDLGVLWDLAERAGVTMFGTSAAYIGACMKAGVEPGSGRDLSALKAVCSTGSPLSPEGFDWIYEHVGEDTWLFSTSGGTALCPAFVGAVPTLPVYRGELQARALGAAVESWDEDGNSLTGEVGELVITKPMPSMPLYLWGDEDGSRYHDSYYSTFPGVWRHGDWIEITERGTASITGRSGATINRGGVRMGTSELYRSVLALDEVLDALVVDVPDGEGSRMTLFIVLRDGATLDDGLEVEIRRRIRDDCSPRHVPDAVFAAPEIPRTLSGKILEVPVKRLLMGAAPDEVASRDSLANPDALDCCAGLTAGRG